MDLKHGFHGCAGCLTSTLALVVSCFLRSKVELVDSIKHSKAHAEADRIEAGDQEPLLEVMFKPVIRLPDTHHTYVWFWLCCWIVVASHEMLCTLQDEEHKGKGRMDRAAQPALVDPSSEEASAGRAPLVSWASFLSDAKVCSGISTAASYALQSATT